MRKVFERNISKLLAMLGLTVALANLSWAGEKILYTFGASQQDGYAPQCALIFDSRGNLYGTTYSGGTHQGGTVFELSPGSNGSWTEKILYNFGGDFDGQNPYAGLVFDSKGNLYGTTNQGGYYGSGSVFELTAGAGSTWSERVIYSFNSYGSGDGFLPASTLILDQAGNLYGNTGYGGAFGYGTVFELSPGANGTWTEKLIHSFTGNDGGLPAGALARDESGKLYGTAYELGPNDYGNVFELTPGAGGTWTEKTIFSFNGVNGVSPSGGILIGSAGDLYGTSETNAFELSPGSNGTWTAKTLHFFTGGTGGAYADSGMIFDTQGNLFGTTYYGGAQTGTVFKLGPASGGTWTQTVLHRFSPGDGDGRNPASNLVLDSKGNLYGTTYAGGSSTVNGGVVFEVTQ
jgi:uncharacterized repeat protein (TIGR03803 family)